MAVRATLYFIKKKYKYANLPFRIHTFLFSFKLDPADETLSKESFLQDVDKSLKEFESSGGKLKKELEEVILLQVLPYLEESWGKSSSQKMDAYVILAKLSSCRSCSEVVRHALQQLQYLLFRDNLDSCKESLLKVEKIVRSSIISPDAVFKEEADSAREVRVSVYKRILSLICIYQIQTGFSTVDFKDGLKKLQQDLKHYCTQIRYKKKNYFRYSMEFIQGAISYLLKGSGKATATNLGDCLDNCLSLLENQESDVTKEFPEKLKKIVKKVKTGEWFDLHCVLCYLHGKVRFSVDGCMLVLVFDRTSLHSSVCIFFCLSVLPSFRGPSCSLSVLIVLCL